MDSVNIKRFGAACRIHGDFPLLNIQRHYRNWSRSSLDLDIYITKHLPLPSDILIKSICKEHGRNICFNPASFQSDGIEVRDTLAGLCVSDAGAILLKLYLTAYRPLYDVFCEEMAKLHTESPQSVFLRAYNRFSTSIKGAPLFVKLHCIALKAAFYYHIESEAEARATIQNWIAKTFSYEEIPEECMTLKQAAEQLRVTVEALIEWLEANPGNHEKNGVFYYPSKKSIETLVKKNSHAVLLTTLIQIKANTYPKLILKTAKDAVITHIQDCDKCYLGTIGLAPDKWYYNNRDEEVVGHFIDKILDKLSLYLIDHLISITGYTKKQLIIKATAGVIESTDDFKVSKHEIDRIKAIKNDYIGLNTIATAVALQVDSKFNYSLKKCMNDLHRHINHNKFWGIPAFSPEDIPEINPQNDSFFFRKEDVDELERNLRLWVAGYGKTNHEKIELLLQHKGKEFPDTVSKLSTYYLVQERVLKESDSCALNTIDFLLSVLPCEAKELSEDDTFDAIIEPFQENTNLVNQRSAAQFLFSSKYIKRKYVFESDLKSRIDTSAYSLNDFAVMAYITLNPEAWETCGLVFKAIKNKRFADLWLFVMLHFLAAWRTTDLIRLPVPPLPYAPEETLKRISSGNYTVQEAENVARFTVALVESSARSPHKTNRYAYIPTLKLFVPESCIYPFGLVLSIATAHYLLNKNEPSLVKKIQDIYTIKRFFGDDFAKACNAKNFSTRRANKALMQGVETVGNSYSGGSKGFTFASVMRSHKGSFAKLSSTTAIYLRDANFSGYSSEYVATQMFERGVLSYIVNQLYAIAFGESYMQLPIKAQTSLITQLELPAHRVNGIHHLIKKIEKETAATISAILFGTKNQEETASQILTRLVDGESAGKGSVCIMLAAGKPCCHPARAHCLGCTFEVLTKKTLQHLLIEYHRISEELDSNQNQSISLECERREELINKVLLPKIVEICILARENTNKEELQIYNNIAKEAVKNANRGG